MYVYLPKLISSYVEMFIFWLEGCGDAATDKCYCKRREEIYFPSIYKTCQVNITKELYFYIDKSGLLEVAFFF